ncbi:MAG: carboxypeptidase regulatory-like domain-containing protein [Planctomycetes bacterium]|nr:carboxypeptidase regulatory-like domain-containing protein [Planctomycetota bacterium]
MNRPLVVILLVVVAAVVGAFVMLRGGTTHDGAAGPLAAQSEVAAVAPDVAPSAPSSPEDVGESSERVALESSAPKGLSRESARDRSEGPKVTGRVLDSDGRAVRGAKVLGRSVESRGFIGAALDTRGRFGAFGPGNLETVTDSDGAFELTGVRPGNFRLAVRAPRFAPHDDDDIVVPAGQAHDVGTITLLASPVLSGRVVDSRGRGVAKAEIGRVHEPKRNGGGFFVFGGMRQPSVPLAVSADDGSFTLDQLPIGPLTLAITSEDHPDKSESVESTRPGEQLAPRTIALDNGLEISGRAIGLPEGASRRYSVVASVHNGREQEEEMFEFDGAESRTAKLAADGSFAVKGLREGKRYAVTLRRSERDEPVEFQPRMSARVVATAGDRGIELEFQPESGITMTVLDAQTGKPVEDFQLSGGVEYPMPVMADGRPQTKFPEGKARVGEMRPRGESKTATIEIKATGYKVFRLEDIALVEGQDVDLGAIRLEPAPVCRVTVLDGATGRPIGGARVTLGKFVEPSSDGSIAVRGAALAIEADVGEMQDLDFGGDDQHSGKTDANGVIELSSFAGERCELTVKHKEHAPYRSEPFVCAVGTREEREVRMGAGGSVRVTLVKADGSPIAGGKVERREARDDAGGPRMPFEGSDRAVTDTEGHADFQHLAPGVHRFRQFVEGGNGAFGDGNFFVSIAGMPEDGAGDAWIDAAVAEGSSTEVRVVAPTRSVLSGTVTEGGAKLAGAQVSLHPKRDGAPQLGAGMFGGGPQSTTETDGRYEVRDVKPGDYRLTVTHPSRQMPAEFELSLGESDKHFDVDLDIAIIEGRVFAPDGKPLAGVRVSAERNAPQRSGRTAIRMVMTSDDGGDVSVIGGEAGARDVKTDDDGRYVLRGVTPSVELVVKAESKGLQPERSEPFQVAPNQVKRGVDFTLAVAGKLEVSAFKSGAPASMVVLNVFPEGTSPADAAAKVAFIQNGKTTVDGLKPGKWTVQARLAAIGGPGSGGGAPGPQEQTVEVVADATLPVRFDL